MATKRLIVLVGLFFFGNFRFSSAQEAYAFAAMWPQPAQPWYFYFPTGIAVDDENNIYVADKMCGVTKMNGKGEVLGIVVSRQANQDPITLAVDKRHDVFVVYPTSATPIVKYDAKGQVLASWGKVGTGDGEFHMAQAAAGIALDHAGNVYVADPGNNRIEKFDSDGKFLAQWGSKGDGDGQFNTPLGICLDAKDNIYVVDSGNGQVEKFGPDLKFLARVGQKGTADGELTGPDAVAVDAAGNIYVADISTGKNSHDRIQKFDAGGKFLTSWGRGGQAKAPKFDNIAGIAVDQAGNFFTSETWGFFVRRCDAQGNFTDCWSVGSMDPGKLHWPYGVALDQANHVLYLTDSGTNRIMVYDTSGNYMTEWHDPVLSFPIGIALSDAGFIYVQNRKGTIRKYDKKGNFLLEWGKEGSGDGEFSFGNGCWLATDKQGDVYVADKENNRIQKFDADGKFLLKWGTKGPGDGEFNEPCGIAVDKSSGDVYVAELGNVRIQKFSGDGKFIMKWGSKGNAPGQFTPMDEFIAITTDNAGNFFIADKMNNRIEKFDSTGKFLTAWGSFGFGQGQFGSPTHMAVDSGGAVYVVDSLNSRIQKFTPK